MCRHITILFKVVPVLLIFISPISTTYTTDVIQIVKHSGQTEINWTYEKNLTFICKLLSTNTALYKKLWWVYKDNDGKPVNDPKKYKTKFNDHLEFDGKQIKNEDSTLECHTENHKVTIHIFKDPVIHIENVVHKENFVNHNESTIIYNYEEGQTDNFTCTLDFENKNAYNSIYQIGWFQKDKDGKTVVQYDPVQLNSMNKYKALIGTNALNAQDDGKSLICKAQNVKTSKFKIKNILFTLKTLYVTRTDISSTENPKIDKSPTKIAIIIIIPIFTIIIIVMIIVLFKTRKNIFKGTHNLSKCKEGTENDSITLNNANIYNPYGESVYVNTIIEGKENLNVNIYAEPMNAHKDDYSVVIPKSYQQPTRRDKNNIEAIVKEQKPTYDMSYDHINFFKYTTFK